jgi:hypothetical protein
MIFMRNGHLPRVWLTRLVQIGLGLLLTGSARAGTPHAVYGLVRYSDGTHPSFLQFQAYIVSRPHEILTENSTGSGYDVPSGQWYLQCGNFTTPWAAGDTLRVEFQDDANNLGEVEVILTYSPSDQAPVTILTRYTRRITLNTEPPGLLLTADGSDYTAPREFVWEQGSLHILSAPSPQNIDTDSRYVFSHWGHETAREHTFTVPDSDTSLTAYFTLQHRLTVISTYGDPTGEGWYDAGSTAPFGVTTPAQGDSGWQYIFLSWTGTGNGAYEGTEPSAYVIMNNPITQTAAWQPQVFLGTSVDPPAWGDVEPAPPGIWTDLGTRVVVRAVPDTATGYGFLQWSGDLEGSANPDTLYMDAPKQITARFYLADYNAPRLEYFYPAPGSVFVPRNAVVSFCVQDSPPGYGIDTGSLHFQINEDTLVHQGMDQTGGHIFLSRDSLKLDLIYFPDSLDLAANETLSCRISCRDGGLLANILDTTITYQTSGAHLTVLTRDTLDNEGGSISDTSYHIGLTVIPTTLPQPTGITVGVVDSLPPLPDDIHPFGHAFYFGPAGLEFKYEVTLHVPFTQDDLDSAGVNHPMELPVFYFSSSTGSWTQLETLRSFNTHVDVETRQFCYLTYVRNGGTGVRPAEPASSPAEFRLFPNYPNPFNGSTLISYTLATAGPVRLTIFDARGRLVRELIRMQQIAGSHQVLWDGLGENGLPLTSGVYTVMMRTDSRVFSQKVVMIK